MAVARAQHAVNEMTALLRKRGCQVPIRHSSRCGPFAWAYECPLSGSE